MQSVSKIVFAITAIVLFIPSTVGHALPPPSDVLLTEVQVRSDAATNAASEEFVELYNVTDQPIDVSTWSLEYKSATGTTWTHKVTLHGNLAPHSHYLLVSDKYGSLLDAYADQSGLGLDVFSAGLADSAGHVRIVSPNASIPAMPIVHDILGWGSTADSAEGNAPAAPPGGESLKRTVDSDGKFIDTDDNATDFMLSDTPTPETAPLYVVPSDETPPEPEPSPEPAPEPDPEPDPAPESDEQVSPAPEQSAEMTTSLLPPQITELLPNPAAPASDSKDEFIELYNPNDQAIELAGYKLQSGNTFSYSYTFSTTSLGPHEYRTFMITETSAILSNTSGQARLLDPNGAVVSQTDPYEDAHEGDAWALINGVWQWTETPTPQAKNVLTLPLLKLATAKTATKKVATSKSKPAAKKTTAAKVAAVKTTKPKAAAVERQVYEDPADTEATTPVHPGILAGVGAITLVYAAYEYRHDVVNRLQQFRRYRELRRTARTAAKGE